MRYIVEFSGGLDSSAAIVKALETKPYATYDLMHVQFRGYLNNSWVPQLSAAVKIVAKLGESYPKARFNLQTPVINLGNITSAVSFRVYTKLFGLLYTKKFTEVYEYIINGSTLTDAMSAGSVWPEFGEVVYGDGKLSVEQQVMNTIMERDPQLQLTPWRPLFDTTREDAYNLLPDDIKSLVWSCSRPVIEGDTAKPCGECPVCIQDAELGVGGNTIDISTVVPLLDLCKAQKQELSNLLERHYDDYFV